MNKGIAATLMHELEEPSLRDLLLATVTASERAITDSLMGLLSESARYAAVLDSTAEPITRQKLISSTHIDNTNLSKVTAPLIRGGWLRSVQTPTGLVFRRTFVVDVLLRGKAVDEWRTVVKRRLGTGR